MLNTSFASTPVSCLRSSDPQSKEKLVTGITFRTYMNINIRKSHIHFEW